MTSELKFDPQAVREAMRRSRLENTKQVCLKVGLGMKKMILPKIARKKNK